MNTTDSPTKCMLLVQEREALPNKTIYVACLAFVGPDDECDRVTDAYFKRNRKSGGVLGPQRPIQRIFVTAKQIFRLDGSWLYEAGVRRSVQVQFTSTTNFQGVKSGKKRFLTLERAEFDSRVAELGSFFVG